MAAPTRVCPSCETPLPAEAGFCPSCGEATPTEISGETGSASTLTYDLFLSYNSRDHQSAEALAHILKDRGLTVFLDRWYLSIGRPWQTELEERIRECKAVAVLLGPQGLGSWQQRERDLALARQASDHSFPVIPVLLPGAEPALDFLSLLTWVDLRQDPAEPTQIAALVAATKGETPGADIREQVASTLRTVCPYRGLRAFREEDADFFFGREAFTERLVAAVEARTFVALVGPSGSGKSSVVRAGLVPHLRSPESDRVWDVVTLVPGDRPLRALAAALVPLLQPTATDLDWLRQIGQLASDLERGDVYLRDIVTLAMTKQPGTDCLLLVVDQWEELYTLGSDEVLRRRFVDELLDAVEYSSLNVVLTVRGDLFGQTLEYRPLADRLQDSIVNLGPMTRPELRSAVVTPAERVGLSFETGLVDRILDKVENEPGALPLLEFVLTALWEDQRNRQEGRLLYEAYKAMGEIEGAIARKAEDFFATLSDAEQKMTQQICVQLIRPGEGSEDTRRRASMAELGDGAEVLVRKLSNARLVVTGRDDATGEETVEVSHEALIRRWSRLSEWVEDDREFLQWRHRFREHLKEWESGGRQRKVLLEGKPLGDADHWVRQRRSDFQSAEKQFVEASIIRRRKRRLWTAAAAVVVVGALGSIATVQTVRRIDTEETMAAVEAARIVAVDSVMMIATFQAETAVALRDMAEVAAAEAERARIQTAEARIEILVLEARLRAPTNRTLSLLLLVAATGYGESLLLQGALRQLLGDGGLPSTTQSLDELIVLACDRAGRNLTNAERASFGLPFSGGRPQPGSPRLVTCPG